jgi:molybdopterin converting factor small subunit
MRCRVLLFAHLADRCGPNHDLTLPDDATGRTVASELGLDNITSFCRVAINSRFASWDDPISDGDEVAILPPVSGG